MTTAVHLTALEERLASPRGSAERDALQARLAEAEQRLRLQMAASLPRDEFATAEAVAHALRCAQEVLAAWPVSPLAPPGMPDLQSFSPPPRSSPWS